MSLKFPPFSLCCFIKFPHISCLECTSQTSMIKFQNTMTTLLLRSHIVPFLTLSPQSHSPPSPSSPSPLSLLSFTPLSGEGETWRDTICVKGKSPYMKTRDLAAKTPQTCLRAFPPAQPIRSIGFSPWTAHPSIDGGVEASRAGLIAGPLYCKHNNHTLTRSVISPSSQFTGVIVGRIVFNKLHLLWSCVDILLYYYFPLEWLNFPRGIV